MGNRGNKSSNPVTDASLGLQDFPFLYGSSFWLNKKDDSRVVRTINVPISLISRLKAEKSSIEMLACAIIIKNKYQNSTLYDLSLKNIMQLFHVSHRKAKQLLERFSQSELFVYDRQRNRLFAKSFKSKEKKVFGKGKKKYEAFADYCYKMQMQKDIRLRDAVRELRDMMLVCTIDSLEKGNFKNVGDYQTDSFVGTPNNKAMTQKRLAGISGMCRSTVCRHLQKMIGEGKVGKTRIVAECVIPNLTADTEREWMDAHPGKGFFAWHSVDFGNWSGWQHHGTEYTILLRSLSDRFRHVIYNYRRRAKTEPKTSAELDGKWGN